MPYWLWGPISGLIVLILYRYISTNYGPLLTEIVNERYNRCRFVITVSLNMKTILAAPHFSEDSTLLKAFDERFPDPDVDQHWHKITFVIVNDLVYINGKLSPYVGYSLSIPSGINVGRFHKLIVGLKDSDIIVYHSPDAMSTEVIAKFPLAYVAYAYNYHPQFLSQSYVSDDQPEFGARETDPVLKSEYDRLRKTLLDGKSDKMLEAKFEALKGHQIEKSGFRRLEGTPRREEYYNKEAGVAVSLSPHDHGL
jgi:hypothetical protein